MGGWLGEWEGGWAGARLPPGLLWKTRALRQWWPGKLPPSPFWVRPAGAGGGRTPRCLSVPRHLLHLLLQLEAGLLPLALQAPNLLLQSLPPGRRLCHQLLLPLQLSSCSLLLFRQRQTQGFLGRDKGTGRETGGACGPARDGVQGTPGQGGPRGSPCAARGCPCPHGVAEATAARGLPGPTSAALSDPDCSAQASLSFLVDQAPPSRTGCEYVSGGACGGLWPGDGSGGDAAPLSDTLPVRPGRPVPRLAPPVRGGLATLAQPQDPSAT